MADLAAPAGTAADPLAIELIEGPAGPLRLATARGATPDAGTVLVLQGRGEVIEKYAPLVRELVAWGHPVLTLDWRGQGGSARLLPDRRKGHVGSFEDYLDDLDAVLASAPARRLPPARFLIGHSMGGQIALRALGDRRVNVAAAALVAPMLDIAFGPIPRWAARTIARTAVKAGLGGGFAPGQARQIPGNLPFEGNPITADRERFIAWQELMMRRDELAIGGVTFGWLDAALRSIDRSRRPDYLRAITTPVLLMLAEAETIVDNAAIAAAAALLPRSEILTVPAARHDLFLAQDAARDELLRVLRTFLARFSPPP